MLPYMIELFHEDTSNYTVSLRQACKTGLIQYLCGISWIGWIDWIEKIGLLEMVEQNELIEMVYKVGMV